MHQNDHQFQEPSPSKKVKENQTALSILKEHTIVVADSGKIQEIEKYKPQDATTNPTLILEAVIIEQYRDIVDRAMKKGIEDYMKRKSQALPAKRVPKRKKKNPDDIDEENGDNYHPDPEPQDQKNDLFNYKDLDEEQKKQVVQAICDQMCVQFGVEISKLVPGYVSTEVDARLSFDKQGSINRAKQIIALYEEAGIPRDRILIKLAATWEGIEAAKVLRKEKILCNMTLIFNFYQAVACAQANVRLISPFVGRILDWFKKDKKDADFSGEKDPGVQLVTRVWKYFKKYKHDTIVMAASFRTMEETQMLCGCDRMTIPLSILEQLRSAEGVEFERKLTPQLAQQCDEEKVLVDEKMYRYQLAVDPMANDRLADGIKRFADDIERLERLIEERLQTM